MNEIIQTDVIPQNHTEEKEESTVAGVSEREKRAEELEQTFTYDGYQIVRKELFAHLRDPAITIRKDSVTFNTACIEGLEEVVYIHMMFNKDLKRIVVEGCEENDKDALRWCIAKPDKRKSRKMAGKPFSELVYREMDWDSGCRYKILGYRIQFEGKTLYVFDLTVPEVFREGSKRKKKDVPDLMGSQEQMLAVNTRKGYYPDDIANTFGVPVEQHRADTEFRQMDGYVTVGALTGRIQVQESVAAPSQEMQESAQMTLPFGQPAKTPDVYEPCWHDHIDKQIK